ncbi:unnamed protein product [Vitrella brassicaformis CCMP3155]|uniref:Uncharacterized protein n=2 Tax=Vitrella brassicaformis TaxID=1169539 RepID=A0A0G4FVH8_VITBC|nr:unnamed protein product [Vitrella brassicaformis CCMP3155]|eukprot:CEM19223.1 unnamed protein product [Vitrella brassicaformis CCMP3155]
MRLADKPEKTIMDAADDTMTSVDTKCDSTSTAADTPPAAPHKSDDTPKSSLMQISEALAQGNPQDLPPILLNRLKHAIQKLNKEEGRALLAKLVPSPDKLPSVESVVFAPKTPVPAPPHSPTSSASPPPPSPPGYEDAPRSASQRTWMTPPLRSIQSDLVWPAKCGSLEQLSVPRSSASLGDAPTSTSTGSGSESGHGGSTASGVAKGEVASLQAHQKDDTEEYRHLLERTTQCVPALVRSLPPQLTDSPSTAIPQQPTISTGPLPPLMPLPPPLPPAIEPPSLPPPPEVVPTEPAVIKVYAAPGQPGGMPNTSQLKACESELEGVANEMMQNGMLPSRMAVKFKKHLRTLTMETTAVLRRSETLKTQNDTLKKLMLTPKEAPPSPSPSSPSSTGTPDPTLSIDQLLREVALTPPHEATVAASPVIQMFKSRLLEHIETYINKRERELKESVTVIRERDQEEMNVLKGEVDRLQEEVPLLKKTIEAIGDRDLHRMEDRVMRALRDYRDIRENDRNRIEALEKERKEMEETLERCKVEHRTNTAKITQYSDKVAHLQRAVREYKGAEKLNATTMAGLKIFTDDLKGALSKVLGEKRSLQQQLSVMEQRLTASERDAAILREEINRMKSSPAGDPVFIQRARKSFEQEVVHRERIEALEGQLRTLRNNENLQRAAIKAITESLPAEFQKRDRAVKALQDEKNALTEALKMGKLREESALCALEKQTSEAQALREELHRMKTVGPPNRTSSSGSSPASLFHYQP